MKSLILLTALAISGSAIGQNQNESVPTPMLNTRGTFYYDREESELKNYYNSIQPGDKGDTLLTKLQTILSKGQQKLNYGSGSLKSKNRDGYYLYERNYDLSPLTEEELGGKYKTSDIWVNSLYTTSPIYIETSINSGNYKYYNESGDLVTGQFKIGNTQFDREHVFPKSFGFNGKDDAYKDFTAGCDIQNLHIGEHVGNSDGHSNHPYGNVIKNKEEIKSGLTGEVIGYQGLNEDNILVFEPLDKDKGDIARSIFYMAARYHTYEKISDKDRSPSLTLGDKVKAIATMEPEETINKPVAYGQLSDLLERNIIDPVDKYEVHRNNLVYNSFQKNRNPFIDYPSWAEACFKPDQSEGIKFEGFNSIDSTSSQNQDKYVLSITADETFKKSYYQFENFNTSGLNVSLTKNGEIVAEIPQTITYLMGDQVMTNEYMILGVGKHAITAAVTIDGRTIYSSNSIEVSFELSTTQVIIACVIGAIILILLIMFFVWLSKKKNRRKAKAFENKVKKVTKKAKKKSKKDND